MVGRLKQTIRTRIRPQAFGTHYLRKAQKPVNLRLVCHTSQGGMGWLA